VKISPCKECGGKAIVIIKMHFDSKRFFVSCRVCSNRSSDKYWSDEEAAITDWNENVAKLNNGNQPNTRP